MHPHRLRFGSFSEQNPLMRQIKPVAEEVRSDRKAVKKDNPLVAAERMASSLDHDLAANRGRRSRRHDGRRSFSTLPYGSPWLRAAVGLSSRDRDPASHRARSGARGGHAGELPGQI